MGKKLKSLIASGLAVLNIGTIFGPTVGAIPGGSGDSTSQEGVKPLDPVHLRFIDPADTHRVEEIRKSVEKMDSILREIRACQKESDAGMLEFHELEKLYLEKRKEREQITAKLIKLNKDYESAKEEYRVVNGQKEYEEKKISAKREQEERERAAAECKCIAQFRGFVMRINFLINKYILELGISPDEVFRTSYPYVYDKSMESGRGGIPGINPQLSNVGKLMDGMRLLAEAKTYGDLHSAISLYLGATPREYKADMCRHPFFNPKCSYSAENVSVPSVFISKVLKLRKGDNLSNEELIKAAKEIVIVNAMIWLNGLSKRLLKACKEHNPGSERIVTDGYKVKPFAKGDTATIGVMKLLPSVYFQDSYLDVPVDQGSLLWKGTSKYFNVKEQMDNTKEFVRLINIIRKKSDDFTPEIQDLYRRFVCLANSIDKELQAASL